MELNMIYRDINSDCPATIKASQHHDHALTHLGKAMRRAPTFGQPNKIGHLIIGASWKIGKPDGRGGGGDGGGGNARKQGRLHPVDRYDTTGPSVTPCCDVTAAASESWLWLRIARTFFNQKIELRTVQISECQGRLRFLC